MEVFFQMWIFKGNMVSSLQSCICNDGYTGEPLGVGLLDRHYYVCLKISSCPQLWIFSSENCVWCLEDHSQVTFSEDFFFSFSFFPPSLPSPHGRWNRKSDIYGQTWFLEIAQKLALCIPGNNELRLLLCNIVENFDQKSKTFFNRIMVLQPVLMWLVLDNCKYKRWLKRYCTLGSDECNSGEYEKQSPATWTRPKFATCPPVPQFLQLKNSDNYTNWPHRGVV